MWLEPIHLDLSDRQPPSTGGDPWGLDPVISCLRIAVERIERPAGDDDSNLRFRGTAQGRGLLDRLRRSPASRGHSMDRLVAGIGEHTALAVASDHPREALGTVAQARRSGMLERLWITSHDLEVLDLVRADSPATRILHACDPAKAPGGPERHAADIRERGIEGVMVPAALVSAGLVALFGRFGRVVGAEGAQHPRLVRAATRAGADIVCGPSVAVLREGSGL